MAAPTRTLSFILLTFLMGCIRNNGQTLAAENHVDDRRGFSLKLIHRDSPHSPLYNPNATAEDLLESTERQSLARLRYIQSKVGGGPQLDYSHGEAPVTPGDHPIYLTTVTIGSNAIKVVAMIDTGSSISWIQCLPCTNCFRQAAPIYDPSKSLTYNPVPCSERECEIPHETKCISNKCMFKVDYLDGRYTSGDFAVEDFTITLPETKAGIVLNNVLFGCAHNSSLLFFDEIQGVIALDASISSFAVETMIHLSLKHAFSYCLVPLTQMQHGSQLTFGDTAVLAGNPTPMAVPLQRTTRYYLNLDDISVGSERLGILPGTFRLSPTGSGGLIIDCGSTYTYLVPAGYDAVVAKLRQVVPLTVYMDHPILCFEGTSADFPNVPDITFHFENLDVVTKASSNFYEVKRWFGRSLICLGMRSSANVDLSVLGVMQQQNMNVGYDLEGRQVYISPTDCQTF